jgi:hypothetical protein
VPVILRLVYTAVILVGVDDENISGFEAEILILQATMEGAG